MIELATTRVGRVSLTLLPGSGLITCGAVMLVEGVAGEEILVVVLVLGVLEVGKSGSGSLQADAHQNRTHIQTRGRPTPAICRNCINTPPSAGPSLRTSVTGFCRLSEDSESKKSGPTPSRKAEHVDTAAAI